MNKQGIVEHQWMYHCDPINSGSSGKEEKENEFFTELQSRGFLHATLHLFLAETLFSLLQKRSQGQGRQTQDSTRALLDQFCPLNGNSTRVRASCRGHSGLPQCTLCRMQSHRLPSLGSFRGDARIKNTGEGRRRQRQGARQICQGNNRISGAPSMCKAVWG